MDKPIAIQLKNITKTFGEVIANKNVDMDVRKGEILSVLGENGSGKTTLMNMIAGIYYPDEGQIYIDGEEVSIRSPKDAFRYKIGMIHQHFKLVDVFSAAQNIVLGVRGEKYNLKEVNARVREMSEKYGFHIDPKKKIHEMSVSEKQTVEIVKVLYRGADILILDEPTRGIDVVTKHEIYETLRNLAEQGVSIVMISSDTIELLNMCTRVLTIYENEINAELVGDEITENSLVKASVFRKESV